MNLKRVMVSDRTLSLLLRVVAVVLVVGIPLFIVIYWLDQRVESGPSLAERQVQAAEEQVRAAPSNIALRLALAKTYRQANRLDDAKKQYDEIIKADPSNKLALLGRGEVNLAKGDSAAASSDFEKIVAIGGTGQFAAADPQLQAAHYYLGQIAVDASKLDDAVKQLLAALKIDKTDADAWYLLGTVYLKQGATDKAIEAQRLALSFVPTDWCEPYQQLGAAYTKAGNAAEAEYAGAMVDFCQKRGSDAVRRLTALLSGPAKVDALLGLGMVAESAGNRAEATSWYQKALVVDPKNAAALTALNRLGVTANPTVNPTTSRA